MHPTHHVQTSILAQLSGCRQEAKLAREQLQARVTILEGRVRFLEAGYELRPAAGQLQALPPAASQQQVLQYSPGRQQAPPLALTWGAPGSGSGGGWGAAVVGCSVGPTGLLALQAKPAVHQAGAATAPPPSVAMGYRQHTTRSNPLFDGQPPAPPAAASTASMQVASVQPSHASSTSWHQGGAGSVQRATAGLGGLGAPAPVAPPARSSSGQQQVLPPPLPPAPIVRPHGPGAAVPAAPPHRSYSNTSELISGMQARCMEAEEFLLSLQRR